MRSTRRADRLLDTLPTLASYGPQEFPWTQHPETKARLGYTAAGPAPKPIEELKFEETPDPEL